MIAFLVGLLLMSAQVLASAQASDPRVVTGTVQDSVGGSVSGADVFVACGPTWRHTETDGTGHFEFVGLPPSRCGLRVERDQFAPQRMTVDIAREDRHVVLVLDIRGLTTEVAVTSTRASEESVDRSPFFTTVTSADDIRERATPLLPLALAEEPGIAVQQTTSSQGVPIIRGMVGQQNVVMIDGIRLNTAAWRSGPSQYMAWYDPSLVDRIEVMRGPASTLYGSDALGGVIYIRSRQPAFSTGPTTVSGGATLTASTADRDRNADALVSVASPRVGLIAGGGYHDVRDLRPGGGRDSHAAVTRFLGLPSSVVGADRLQKTGYAQRFGHAAVAFGLDAATRVDLSYHYDEQSGASRYDRIAGGQGLHRSEFGPQRLDLAQARVERGRTGVFDLVSASFSVNRQEDGRLEQSRPGARIDEQVNTTTSLGYQAHGARRLGRHDVTLGGEWYDEQIGGTRQITSPTGERLRARPDVPDGTSYASLGLFAQDVFEAVPGRLWLRGGVRYGRFDFQTTADPELGVLDESVTADAVTLQSGAVFGVTDALSLTFAAGRGFRAPNAFDLGGIGVTSVFEVSPERAAALGGQMGTTGGATAVSTGRAVGPLNPEIAYSYEAGARYRRGRVAVSVSLYDLELRDAIQRRTVLFPGDVVGTAVSGFEIVRQDGEGRAFIESQASPMVTRVNVSRARVVGLESESSVRVADGWTASAYFGYSRGTDLDAGVPRRRVPPGMGGVRVRWDQHQGLWIEGVGQFSLRHTRMAPGDVSDARMGARRDRNSIARYFNGTAGDLGLVRNGVLVETGESLVEVQQRLLGERTSAPLFTELPGYFVLSARAGYRVNVLTGKLRYVFRNFPLERIHPNAFKAALTGECVRQRGAFWALHGRLFANQQALGDRDLLNHASAVGMDAVAFQRCVVSPAMTAKVRQDLRDGVDAGVTGTPTFFFGVVQPDGTLRVLEKLAGAVPYATFQSTIDRLLASPDLLN